MVRFCKRFYDSPIGLKKGQNDSIGGVFWAGSVPPSHGDLSACFGGAAG